jgi:hypothetical protein
MTVFRSMLPLALAAFVGTAAAQPYRDVYTPYDGASGLTCVSFNQHGTILWHKRGGDIGPAAVTLQALPVTGQLFTFDATPLLDAEGILVRGNRIVNFHSREALDPAVRPRLVVTQTDGTVVTVGPIADATLSCSSAGTSGQGASTIIKVENTGAMLFFPKVMNAAVARLELTTQYRYSGTATPTYTLHPVIIPRAPETPAPVGIASKYPNDEGIGADSDVLWHTGYEAGDPYGTGSRKTCPATDPPVAGFDPEGRARVQETRMGTRGTWDVSCYPGDRERFAKEEREVFLRMEIRFGSNFRDTSDGGKLPLGFTSQYDDAAGQEYCGNAGMSCASGDRGWSARGGYTNMTDRSNPVYPRVLGAQYVYHYQQTGQYGDHVPWGPRALFEQNRWYTIEMQIKVNDPGVANGEMRWWVDGKLSREVTGYLFRGPTTLSAITAAGGEQAIRGLWLAFFHGGKYAPEHEMHAWVDNVVAARSYIGPRTRTVTFPGPFVCEAGKRPVCQ